MPNSEYQALKSALLWHLDVGVDAPLSDQPGKMVGMVPQVAEESAKESVKSIVLPMPAAAPTSMLLGASESRSESVKLALAAQTIDELRAAIAGFDGIGLRDTATNLVFCDGHPGAAIMLIGEAPGADEDRIGKPFVGASGQLLDKILKTAGLDRADEDALKAIYISNILNWRPPGNRTPTPAEVEVSLPFIERHIQLVKPKMILLAGAVAAQALLGTTDSISKLRGRWIEYLPQTPELQKDATPIPVLATYHPAYLLRTPAQKRSVWGDMPMVLEKRRELGLVQ